ncbi:hypothetical protein PVK06_004461 [Gossypium arboreum]|uniref:Uncharacterized protein n=1 Tax=Gossypium arboreum TaxID=29729 RepID=A0ABR0QTC1_GOSAR|nr:hypothetical protein PVK06_004461 [Gossypium arboreum]
MASSPLNVQPSFHAHSNSLPSRQHPITSQIDENLNGLRASQSASTSSSSIGHELTCLQDLRGGVKGLGDEVRKYLTSKKEVRKAISKASKNLKHMDNKRTSKDGPEASSRWPLVSKLMHQKRVRCKEEEEKTNKIANAEVEFRSFIKSGNVKHVENVQNELQNSELCIQDIEEGRESFFRCLIKARVTVLNIFNC